MTQRVKGDFRGKIGKRYEEKVKFLHACISTHNNMPIEYTYRLVCS